MQMQGRCPQTGQGSGGTFIQTQGLCPQILQGCGGCIGGPGHSQITLPQTSQGNASPSHSLSAK
jgi:hypothetical protein